MKKQQLAKSKKGNLIRSAIFILSACLTVSCTQSSSQKRFKLKDDSYKSDIRVTVSTGGRQVKNLNQDLVQRFETSESNVSLILAGWPGSFFSQIKGVEIFDAQGGHYGFKVTGCKHTCSKGLLSLEIGDIVTAVGKKSVRKTNDFLMFFRKLKDERFVSLTFLRKGKHRKHLYSISK